MIWKVEFSKAAGKQFDRLDRVIQRRLAQFIETRMSPMDDPRRLGEPLKGSQLGEYWKFRVGDYRLICDIQDRRLIILIVELGHRSDIYR